MRTAVGLAAPLPPQVCVLRAQTRLQLAAQMLGKGIAERRQGAAGMLDDADRDALEVFKENPNNIAALFVHAQTGGEKAHAAARFFLRSLSQIASYDNLRQQRVICEEGKACDLGFAQREDRKSVV